MVCWWRIALLRGGWMGCLLLIGSWHAVAQTEEIAEPHPQQTLSPQRMGHKGRVTHRAGKEKLDRVNRTPRSKRRAHANPPAAVNPPARMDQGAVLSLAEQVCDFGRISRRGGELVREIVFTNTGDAPLVITRIITSNTCLKASCSHKPLEPGASGVIRVVYQPWKSDPGAFNRVVQIYSNSATGVAHITVRGHSFEQVKSGRRARNNGLKTKHKKADRATSREVQPDRLYE